MTVLQGSLLVFFCGTIFSLGGLAFRLTDDINAWQYVVFRGAGALVVTAVILAWRYRGRFGTLAGDIAPSHYLAGLLLGAMSTLFILSLEHASVAFVLFLQALAPLSAAYFSWVLLRERVSNAVVVATVVSLIGVGIMVSATVTDAVAPLGLLAALIPLCFGLYATIIRGAEAIEPQIPILLAAATLVFAGLVGAFIAGDMQVSLSDAAIGLFAGGILLALPGAVMNVANRVVPAPDVGLLLMSEVVLAPLWVWLFVDEDPQSTTLIGGAVILAAVFGMLAWRRQQASYVRLTA